MNLTIFAYRTIPVTLLISSIYIAIFTALFITDSVPEIPQDTHGLDIERAYADLHNITARPHPYHSHANDIVRKFLLSRINEITTGCAYAHVKEDTNTTSFMKSGNEAVVFQASNILVKIDGYDDRFIKSGGVLFSAHYDSVSTAPGATDDGIAVASLLQFIEHLVKNQPRRTAIFNINNGEEDGLYGAQAFVRHPWAKMVDSFINLEGAGAGGPPILFRASSIEPVRAFSRGITTNSTTYRVRRPHGNVLSADAFNRGVIRSGTDYSVYVGDSEHILEGVDLAFYKHRSRYHTMLDSIPGVRGKAKEALWAMLENVWGAGGVLLNIESPKPETSKMVVFFDLFKSYFVVFELRSLQTFNLVLLFAGPFLVLFIHTAIPFFLGHFNVEIEEERPSILTRVLNVFRRRSTREAEESSRNILFQPFVYVAKAWSWGNLWIPTAMFFPTTVLYAITVKSLLAGNRYITYSQQNAVLLLNLSIALIVLTFLLGSPAISSRLRSRRTKRVYILPDRQAIFLHLYVFTYLLLIFATLAVTFEIGGLYWISAWHAGVWAACIIGGLETFIVRSQRVKELEKKTRRQLLNRDAHRASRNGQRHGSGDSSDSDEGDEMTPLLPGSLTLPDQNGEPPLDGKDNGGWWILQVLLAVPIPVMLIGHIFMLFQSALGQTLADGSSAAFVYITQALLCIFMVLPIAPFASGIHRYVTYIAAITFLGTLILNLSVFPFSQETPLKVYFQQSVHLNSTNTDLTMSGNHLVEGEVIRAVTSLTGVPEFIENQVVSKLPSAWRKELNCGIDEAGRWKGLVTCSWESGADMIPYPGGRPKQPWLSVSTQRTGFTKARIEVEGKNARSCRFYFDQTLIVQVSLTPKTEIPVVSLYPTYKEEDGGILQYWAREWGKAIVIEVDFNGIINGTYHESDNGVSESGGNLRGRVACEWSEYESGMVGLDLNEIRGVGYLNPRMPALEESLRFLPQWAVVSKAGDGLVEAWSEFEF
ncbi:hypothetical protein M378DRAFT_24781 [Amanita muscaria Koide BX008]|uniref:Peptide hydrolase n=1 Tax=Amanita muscaria (strain Koide BX008) TaxID=946122 RepID=A0A0C2WQV0_AMAMK|nr:hypothetical protein M378DRAFT_24781 [Amanita muscaria Koide BX008]